ncbi:MAG: DUF2807 domain-containing protein, partial [Bacteroidia bacterium]|nr:DUF2807 domain-containing protein [Bacteroidia bacterium]
MRRSKFILFIAFISLKFVSCEDGFDCLKPTGKTITEERALAFFDRMNITGNVNVQIEYGVSNLCKVRAGENLIDDIQTEVIGGTLFIDNKNGCNWVRSFKNEYVVQITLDTLKRIDYSGVGDIDFVNDFEVDSLRIEVYDGWGDINLKY